MRTYPRQKLYDVGHGQFFRAWMSGRLNDGDDGGFVETFKAFIGASREVIPMSRGRLGAYFAIKESVAGRRRKVLMSPFTIFDMINMVVLAGGEPVFYDSEPDSPHVTRDRIASMLDDETAAVVVTHYHTSNPEIAAIAETVRAAGAKLMEDCAISVGGRPGGKPVGLHGDFGLFSFGLFKFVATYFGGALVVKDADAARRIEAEMASWPKMGADDLRSYLIKGLKLDTLTQPVVFNGLTFPVFRFGYVNDIAPIKKQAINDPQPVERSALPEHYMRRPSDFQQREWARQIPKVMDDRARRLENARAYHQALRGSNSIVIPPLPDAEADCFLNFPVLVDDRDRVLKELMKRGFDASQYYYHNCAELEAFKAHHRALPNMESFVRRVIILPTYPSVPPEYARALSAALLDIVSGREAAAA